MIKIICGVFLLAFIALALLILIVRILLAVIRGGV